MGKYLILPLSGYVYNTVSLGRSDTINILVKLAMASSAYLAKSSLVACMCLLTEADRIELTLSFSATLSANFSNLSGSMWQTSPREPENKQVKSAPRTPITRLNSNINRNKLNGIPTNKLNHTPNKWIRYPKFYSIYSPKLCLILMSKVSRKYFAYKCKILSTHELICKLGKCSCSYFIKNYVQTFDWHNGSL